jgi:DNA/RNA-binding protein KIN17
MMQIASQNKSLIYDKFSREFEEAFMDIVKRRCRGKSVLANKIYNEYISDRQHLHMNATRYLFLH